MVIPGFGWTWGVALFSVAHTGGLERPGCAGWGRCVGVGWERWLALVFSFFLFFFPFLYNYFFLIFF